MQRQFSKIYNRGLIKKWRGRLVSLLQERLHPPATFKTGRLVMERSHLASQILQFPVEVESPEVYQHETNAYLVNAENRQRHPIVFQVSVRCGPILLLCCLDAI